MAEVLSEWPVETFLENGEVPTTQLPAQLTRDGPEWAERIQETRIAVGLFYRYLMKPARPGDIYYDPDDISEQGPAADAQVTQAAAVLGDLLGRYTIPQLQLPPGEWYLYKPASYHGTVTAGPHRSGVAWGTGKEVPGISAIPDIPIPRGDSYASPATRNVVPDTQYGSANGTRVELRRTVVMLLDNGSAQSEGKNNARAIK